jgi:uncharacterized coiled-coil protein SlyX
MSDCRCAQRLEELERRLARLENTTADIDRHVLAVEEIVTQLGSAPTKS